MSEKPRIMILIDSLAGGGAERTAVVLSNYLVDREFAVTIVTLHPRARDFFHPTDAVDRVCLDLVATGSPLDKVVVNAKRLLSLRAVLKREKPALVIGFMTSCAILAILGALGLSTKVIVSERNYPGRKAISRSWVLLRKVFYRFADGHAAQTRRTAEWIKEHAGGRNIHVIPNSVAWPIPAKQPSIDPGRWLSSEHRYVLAVGTKPEQKGFDMLISAFARVADDNPSWRLVILGIPEDGGGDSRLVRDQAQNAGVEDKMHLPGLVHNMVDWYRRADLFVLSSRCEGFPNVLLEAMAAGCACISFDCDTGPREIIQNDVNGLLVPAEDVNALSDVMERLMKDRQSRLRLAKQAKYVRSRFGETQVLQRWCEMISDVVQAQPLSRLQGIR